MVGSGSLSLYLYVFAMAQLKATAFLQPHVAYLPSARTRSAAVSQHPGRCAPAMHNRPKSHAHAARARSGVKSSRWKAVGIAGPSFEPIQASSSSVGYSLPGDGEQEFATGISSELKVEITTNPADTRPARAPRAAARVALAAASALAVAGLAMAIFTPEPAMAVARKAADYVNAGVDPSEHLHVGQEIANFFRRGGLPDWATLMTISAMPVVELRGGVPVGIWMGMPLVKTFGLCVAGNMVPIPVILLALRLRFVQKFAKPVLDRARAKAKDFGDEKSQALALTLFVGIPLPGTGAWTGAMGAFLLGMPFGKVRSRHEKEMQYLRFVQNPPRSRADGGINANYPLCNG